MTWYYVNEGKACGPISAEELASQLRTGAILPETLVWRSGMSEWQSASSVTAQISPAPAAPPPPALNPGFINPAASLPPLAAPSSGAPPVMPHFFCACCGTIIPADQLVWIGGRTVCATCKPGFLQRLSEGVPAPVKRPVLATPGAFARSETDLADPGVRLVGYILDLLFIGLPLFFVYLLLMVALGAMSYAGGAQRPMLFLMLFPVFFGVAVLWTFSYWTIFIGRRGATPGMKIMKIKMVRADRSSIGYGLALGRAVMLYFINLFSMGLTNITAFFDPEKRTVVDMICHTRVVRTDL